MAAGVTYGFLEQWQPCFVLILARGHVKSPRAGLVVLFPRPCLAARGISAIPSFGPVTTREIEVIINDSRDPFSVPEKHETVHATLLVAGDTDLVHQIFTVSDRAKPREPPAVAKGALRNIRAREAVDIEPGVLINPGNTMDATRPTTLLLFSDEAAETVIDLHVVVMLKLEFLVKEAGVGGLAVLHDLLDHGRAFCPGLVIAPGRVAHASRGGDGVIVEGIVHATGEDGCDFAGCSVVEFLPEARHQGLRVVLPGCHDCNRLNKEQEINVNE